MKSKQLDIYISKVLKRFCAKGRSPFNLPLNQGDYTYATNQFAIVRTQKLSDFETVKRPDFSVLAWNAFDQFDDIQHWKDVPVQKGKRTIAYAWNDKGILRIGNKILTKNANKLCALKLPIWDLSGPPLSPIPFMGLMFEGLLMPCRGN